VKAAFFLVGDRVEKYPDLVARIHREGHLAANHSHRHGFAFPFLLAGAAGREIDACNAAIARVIGATPRLFRAPLGFKNPALGDALRRRGMVAVGWQARGYDAVERSAEAITRRVLAQVRPGGVVLLHDGAGLGGTSDRRPTLEALPGILDGLRARGLDLVRLDALLEEEPYQTGAGEPS
jgi:peptidoglycan/xylan/chitin deacetylase (PgdA/CDA1 family)